MINRSELEKCKAAEIEFCDKSALADLRDINIDRGKPVTDRIESFVKQAKNPYLFKVGDVAVKVEYSGGKDFSGALSSALFVS